MQCAFCKAHYIVKTNAIMIYRVHCVQYEAFSVNVNSAHVYKCTLHSVRIAVHCTVAGGSAQKLDFLLREGRGGKKSKIAGSAVILHTV